MGLLLSSLIPPGAVAVVEKDTAATRVAITKHELDILFSHSPPLLASSWCDSLKISLSFLPSLL